MSFDIQKVQSSEQMDHKKVEAEVFLLAAYYYAITPVSLFSNYSSGSPKLQAFNY